MPLRVGINGFGAIGRRFTRIALGHPDIEVVATNDLAPVGNLAHLFKYDSTYGVFDGEVEAAGDALVINGRRIPVFTEREPGKLPWRDAGVDVVIESTGRFTDKVQAEQHITGGGAKKVVISAPAKGEDITVVPGVNWDRYDPARHHVISNASCTTNCLAITAKVLHDRFGIARGLMSTAHAYTNDQVILDNPVHRDLRRARAGAVSIIPTTTGAAKAIGLVLPELDGKLNGMAFRVPVPTVSVVDLVAELQTPATAEEINAAYREAAAGPLKGFLAVSDAPLVSVDFKGTSESAILDAPSTMVVDRTLVKVVAWYDNEWGYSARLVDLVEMIGRRGL